MGPIAKLSLIDNLAGHIAATLGVDTADDLELDGVHEIAGAAIDYFASSVRGAPSGAGQTLLWAIFSALWEAEGILQDEIDSFFSTVTVDPVRMFQAWRALPAEERAQTHSVALIPGSLTEADIVDVVAALYRQRSAA